MQSLDFPFLKEKIMHRKKKIPASFIIAFVISFIVSFSISRLIPKFVPAAARRKTALYPSWDG